ncbi:MAG: hypothetical protein AABX69_02330, partial [Nanoarchaeota archaeon]
MQRKAGYGSFEHVVSLLKLLSQLKYVSRARVQCPVDPFAAAKAPPEKLHWIARSNERANRQWPIAHSAWRNCA